MNTWLIVGYLYMIGNAFIAGNYNGEHGPFVRGLHERAAHSLMLMVLALFGVLMLLWEKAIEPFLDRTQISFFFLFFFTKKFNNLSPETIQFLRQAMPTRRGWYPDLVRWTFRLVLRRNRVSDRTESPEPASGEDLEGERGPRNEGDAQTP